ncbi:MAG: hypothetical protein R3B55_00870 [Candidatus Paceibacterota bacterium]
MERKRDVKEMEFQKKNGLSNINSQGGGFTEQRNLAGFGNRGKSTPNEGSGSPGFKKDKPEDN